MNKLNDDICLELIALAELYNGESLHYMIHTETSPSIK